MQVLIENYRGFEIYFDTNQEKFISAVGGDDYKESESYSSIKQRIDEFKRKNKDFTPFFVLRRPEDRSYHSSSRDRVEIVGIRKDWDFTGKDSEGKKFRLSSYDFKKYVVEQESDKEVIKDYTQVKKNRDNVVQEYDDKLKSIAQKISGRPLLEVWSEIEKK